MQLTQAYEVLSRSWQDELVIVNLGHSAWTWHTLHQDTDKVWFHQFTTMGLTAPLGLGLAANLPEANVWVLDGDGSFLLNFGSILALAEQQPANMVYLLTSNRSYRTIGGYPLPAQETIDYVGVAKSLGIRNAYSIEDIDEGRELLPKIVSAGEFAFVSLEVDSTMPGKLPIPWEASEMKFRFGRHIERQFGVEVFGPWGY
jgi:thiamine pyrophosphate-dependent acetolactate synthase large subunit-like protein